MDETWKTVIPELYWTANSGVNMNSSSWSAKKTSKDTANPREKVLTLDNKIIGGDKPIESSDSFQDAIIRNSCYWMGPEIAAAKTIAERISTFGRWKSQQRDFKIRSSGLISNLLIIPDFHNLNV